MTSIMLSRKAKHLAYVTEILRFAQNDIHHLVCDREIDNPLNQYFTKMPVFAEQTLNYVFFHIKFVVN
jgi:hypothetical protein